MARNHIVEAGECFATIARRYGFHDYRVLYEHALNKELREQRPNPNILFPGDVIKIPDLARKEEISATGKVHRFVVNLPRKVLRVRLLDAKGEPLRNEEVEAFWDGQTGGYKKRTDGSGILELELGMDVQSASIEVEGRKFPLELGHLNPLDEAPDEGASGVQGRLKNLGYYRGRITDKFDSDTRMAIWLFQYDEGLKTDGRATRETMKKLIAEHGC